ncbi:MAG: L,D-transpeptidase family protein [Chitinispirillaceae bacterium]
MLENIKTILSFKLKELEFRFQTWKRAREISRAYGNSLQESKPRKPRIGKIIKICSISSFALLLVIGLIKVFSFLPSLAAQQPPSGSRSHQKTEQVENKSVDDSTPHDPSAKQIEVAQISDTAQQVKEDTVPEKDTSISVIDHLLAAMPPNSAADYMILSNKATKTMYLLKSGKGRFRIISAYAMASGQQQGRKRTFGDKKTPEGIYYIVGRKEESELSSIYGPIAFVLNYPNQKDRSEKRTGQGIWIHGSEYPDSPPEYTAGCLALANSDILELAETIGFGFAVPVVIISGTEGKAHASEIDFHQMETQRKKISDEYQSQQKVLKQVVTDWKTAWESEDIETYSTFYDTSRFREGNQRWEAFRARKVRTFSIYDTINIEISKFALTSLSESRAVVKFRQVYATNLNRMVNGKRLVFRKRKDAWKIVREGTFPQEELLL